MRKAKVNFMTKGNKARQIPKGANVPDDVANAFSEKEQERLFEALPKPKEDLPKQTRVKKKTEES